MKQTRTPGQSLAIKRDMKVHLLVLIMIIWICGCICSAGGIYSEPDLFNPDPLMVITRSDTNESGEAGPAGSEELESAILVLTQPPEKDRIPYTDRNFTSAVKASIAWWMSPSFMSNTSEFRRYQRSSQEIRAEYPEEKQVFFHFIQDSLDEAGNLSPLGSDLILFRGIDAGFAGVVLNNSEYREGSYASTSYDPSVSLDVFGTTGTEGYHNLLVMERKSGEHALYVNEDEREYIIPRGSAWSVIKSVTIDNLTIEADFPLYNRTTITDSFNNVRLIYITPIRELY